MYNANMTNVYKNQQVMTASPEELTLMLYNGAIRFVNESINAIDHGKLEKANMTSVKAQNIVKEFMCTLDMQYEISKNLMALYDYINQRLVQGNIHKDKEQLLEARIMLEDLRDTWQQAMKITKLNRPQQSLAQGVSV